MEEELAQHKVHMLNLLQEIETLKTSSDHLKKNIQQLGDELIGRKQSYQQWEVTLKKAEQIRADCHSQWDDY